MLDLRALADLGDEPDPSPDPCVLADARIHYLYATCNFGPNDSLKQPVFPARASLDGAHTFYPLAVRDRATGEVRPASIFSSRESHPWAAGSLDWWAPEVWQVKAENQAAIGGCLSVRSAVRYLALYSARKEDGELAVGAALADKPWENFEDIGRPLIENTDGDKRGVIDGTFVPFLNAVSWKKDGNHEVLENGVPTKVPTPIYLQRITIGDDTIDRVGPIKTIMINDQPWEGDLVEGPAFWKHGDRIFCFYSANCYLDERYAMGFAYTDRDPWKAEWIKHQGPFISSDSDFIKEAGLAGPGHCMVYALPGTTDVEMAFHAWPKEALKTAREKEGRVPYVVRITFADGMPQVVPGSLRPL